MDLSFPVNGLVLAGGKSVRMGTDKGAMQWHGKEQRYHMADLLTGLCKEVFISCRPGQAETIDVRYQTLTDQATVSGPMAGIITALERVPHAAWLVTACDLPLLDLSTLQYLLAHRNPASIATTFESPHDGLPEPLITIWEPAALPVLKSFAARGVGCPRKVLLNSETTVLMPPRPDALLNANTPQDAARVQQILHEKPASYAG